MTLDTLIAILALLVAVLAIAPRSKILSIKSRIRRRDLFSVFLSLVSIHFLLFYGSLAGKCRFTRRACIVPEWPVPENVFSPGQAAYVLIVIAIVFFGWKLFFSKLKRNKIFAYKELIENLVNTGDYPALFSLMDRDLDQLRKIVQKDFFLSRIWTKILDKHYTPDLDGIANRLVGINQAAPTMIKRLRQKCGSALAWLGKYLPDHDDYSSAANDVFRQVMTSKKVVRELTASRPYFAMRLIDTDVYEIDDFADIYIRELLLNKHSVLYFELRSNQNVGSHHDYHIPKSNKILSYLLCDAKVAEKLGVWKPFGELFLERLDEIAVSQQADPYNRPMGAFGENEKWEDQLFVTIFFFDVMVSKALTQNVQWHMWMYYFPYFVERIIRNYPIDLNQTDTQSEFPTRYAFLLYEIIYTLTSWLRMVDALPPNQENILMTKSVDENENGNIPKSAVFVLTECVKKILLEEKFPEQFQKSIADIALSAYFELCKKQNTESLAGVMRHRFCTSQHEGNGKIREFSQVFGEHVRRQDRVRWSKEMTELGVALDVVT